MNERVKTLLQAAIALIDDLAFPSIFEMGGLEPGQPDKMRDLYQARKALERYVQAHCNQVISTEDVR
jgi:hypothetical protein